MKHISKALVLLMEYINLREDDSYDEQDDEAALACVVEIIQSCSEEEKQALSIAAETLLKEEISRNDSSEERIEDYENFMSEHFFDDEDLDDD